MIPEGGFKPKNDLGYLDKLYFFIGHFIGYQPNMPTDGTIIRF